MSFKVQVIVTILLMIATALGMHMYDYYKEQSDKLVGVEASDKKTNDITAKADAGLLPGDRTVTNLVTSAGDYKDKWSDDRVSNPIPVNCDKLPVTKYQLLKSVNLNAHNATTGSDGTSTASSDPRPGNGN